MENVIDIQYLGQRLLERKFQTWFLFFFKKIEGRPFIIEPIHQDLFDAFQKIYDLESLRQIINIPPRSAKCLGKGTLIRMFDGSSKKVEDIKCDELIMGDDSSPRKVLNINSGKEEMFKITLQDNRSFICNGSHILVLQKTDYNTKRKGKWRYKDEETLITVFDYLKSSKNFKKRNKIISSGAEYTTKSVLIDPYVLGLWLGDGYSRDARIVGHKDDMCFFKTYFNKINYKYSNSYFDKRNSNVEIITINGLEKGDLLKKIRTYNLLKNKHIPNDYLINNRETRLKLLAGLIDTDGHNCINKNNIEFTNKNEVLIDNTIDLCRSLGFYAKKRSFIIKGQEYFRISIKGELQTIPCLLNRKTAKQDYKFRCISEKLQYFKVESLGIGDYYGFELDGNHKFLLANYIVSHNTTMAKYFIAYCLAQNPRCNFIYTSFSQTLLSGIAEELKGILEHPIYKTMYVEGVSSEDVEDKPLDDFWKQYALKTYGKASYSNKLIRTASGGVILFASVGSAITGMGSGVRGSSKFSGALVCFPFETEIKTEIGYLKIGDIVEKKLNIKVWSYNFENKKIELKNIDKFIKHIKQETILVKLSNKETIECTPNHKIYTKNRGWIRADELKKGDCIKTFSYSFYLINRISCFFHNMFSRIIFITDKIKHIFG